MHTTPFLSDPPFGMRHQEPIYVVWIYGEKKQTTLGFFVYRDGAFRYLGMPHAASAKEYKNNRYSLMPSAHNLTDEQVERNGSPIDPAAVQRTVVLQVSVDPTGKPKEVEYVRGPAQYREAAIASVRHRKFDKPGFGPAGIKPSTVCLNIVAPD